MECTQCTERNERTECADAQLTNTRLHAQSPRPFWAQFVGPLFLVCFRAQSLLKRAMRQLRSSSPFRLPSPKGAPKPKEGCVDAILHLGGARLYAHAKPSRQPLGSAAAI
ncbi:hypothetical protein L1887_47610 [Cichorium endivia]|nr:hypothetical protein L1887_47610 [Cichorium endivia]